MSESAHHPRSHKPYTTFITLSVDQVTELPESVVTHADRVRIRKWIDGGRQITKDGHKPSTVARALKAVRAAERKKRYADKRITFGEPRLPGAPRVGV